MLLLTAAAASQVGCAAAEPTALRFDDVCSTSLSLRAHLTGLGGIGDLCRCQGEYEEDEKDGFDLYLPCIVG